MLLPAWHESLQRAARSTIEVESRRLITLDNSMKMLLFRVGFRVVINFHQILLVLSLFLLKLMPRPKFICFLAPGPVKDYLPFLKIPKSAVHKLFIRDECWSLAKVSMIPVLSNVILKHYDRWMLPLSLYKIKKCQDGMAKQYDFSREGKIFSKVGWIPGKAEYVSIFNKELALI